MPEMDGYEFVSALRERGISSPALALTAYAASSDREQALEAGFTRHLAKPVENEVLVRVLGELKGGFPTDSARLIK